MLKNGFKPDFVDWYLIEFEDVVVWLAENSIGKDGLEVAIISMFMRFMMLEKHLQPKMSRTVKSNIKKFLDEHKNELEFERRLGWNYTGSTKYYYCIILERSFKGFNLNH